MANANSTPTIGNDAFNQAELELGGAHSIVDLIYTLSCSDLPDGLCNETLTASLDIALTKIANARTLLERGLDHA